MALLPANLLRHGAGERVYRVPVTTDLVTWQGCYDAGWRDLIVPGAFAHPAKMARGLVVRIFDELFAMGALAPGDVVCDPFAGIGSTGIEAASRGVRFVGVELEPKFIDLQRQNYARHRRDWEAMGRPMPIVVQGDSRNLREVLGLENMAATRSSPPYIGGGHHPDQTGSWNTNGRGQRGGGSPTKESAGYGKQEGQLGQMAEGDIDAIVSSPPYEESVNAASHGIDWSKADPKSRGNRKRGDDCKHGQTLRDQLAYGKADGQLGAMERGDGVDAVVSSPPFLSARSDTTKSQPTVHGGPAADRHHTTQAGAGYGSNPSNLDNLPDGSVDAIICSPPYSTGDSASAQSITTRTDKSAAWVKKNCGSAATEGYGLTPGQLGVMPAGPVADALVSSPPWENNVEGHVRAGKFKNPSDFLAAGRGNGASDEARLAQLKRDEQKTLGDSEGQLGQEQGETFWSAARDIVAESYASLKPGGVAVWVVKHFVRNKQIVDFPGDWRKLCEHVGFETFMEVHASLVTEETKSHLFDGERTTQRSRKSFFRRLAEKKGSPRIDFETVYFMRKPAC